MKKSLVLMITLSLLQPAGALAGPGPGPGPGHGGPGPGAPGPGAHFDRLPSGVETVLIAGLTYYVLNGIFYQRQNDRYVVVEAPPQAAAPGREMTVIDVNGERFYVQEGHYYRRSIQGEYIEVPRPAGL